MDAFDAGFVNSVAINGNNRSYTPPRWGGTMGDTGGSKDVDAFVVLDDSGNGMMIFPEPAALWLLLPGRLVSGFILEFRHTSRPSSGIR